MTRKQDSAKQTNWKELMAGQEDFLRPLIQEVLQQVLEAEMDEAVGAGKGERTANRRGTTPFPTWIDNDCSGDRLQFLGNRCSR